MLLRKILHFQATGRRVRVLFYGYVVSTYQTAMRVEMQAAQAICEPLRANTNNVECGLWQLLSVSRRFPSSGEISPMDVNTERVTAASLPFEQAQLDEPKVPPYCLV